MAKKVVEKQATAKKTSAAKSPVKKSVKTASSSGVKSVAKKLQ